MPLSSIAQPPTYIAPGEGSALLLNAEYLGAGKYSQIVAIADKDNGVRAPIYLNFKYASVPSSVEYDIYVSMYFTDPNASPSTWSKLTATATNTAGDQITIDRAVASGVSFKFLCVLEKTSPAVNATVEIWQ